jgi:hypothetical protein
MKLRARCYRIPDYWPLLLALAGPRRPSWWRRLLTRSQRKIPVSPHTETSPPLPIASLRGNAAPRASEKP